MNELTKILAKDPEDRTEKDLEYLDTHFEELSTEQREQLDLEAKDATEDILEEHTAEFVSKSLKTKKEIKKDDATLEKNIGKHIVRNVIAQVKDLGDGMMEAIVSSEAEDRHGEIIDMKGLDVKQYMKNPIISYLHNHDVPSVGRTHKLTKTKDGKLTATFEWAIKGELKHIHDKARLLYELYKEGFQFAFSIEFIPREVEGNRYTKSEMVGFAPVVVPANPEALLKQKQLKEELGLDKENKTAYNIVNMNLEAILKKIKEEGMESLTLAEVKFLKEHKDDLSANQIKELSAIFKEEEGEGEGDEAPTDETAKALGELAKSVKSLADDVAEMKNIDPVKSKNINGQHSDKNINISEGRYKMFGNTRVRKDFIDSEGKASKEIQFLHYVKGLQKKDFSSYLDIVGKDAMNTTEDGVVIPPAEFIVDLERLEEQFGVAERDALVRRSTSGAGFKYVLGNDDVEVFDTAEAGPKQSTSLSYAEKLLAWRKFAAILPITDELNEDSAIDLWNDALGRFARAYSRQADVLAFTNNSTSGNQKKGVLQETGTNLVTITGDSIADLTYDDLVDMIYGVPSASARDGKFYLNRSLLPVIMKLKDDENRPLWIPSTRDGAPATILGKEYVETEILPGFSDDAADTRMMVFGSLRYVTLGIRTDMQMKVFDTGSVGDPDEEDQESNQMNLLTQDMQALRVVKRMNAVVRFPAAFSVLKTAATS